MASSYLLPAISVALQYSVAIWESKLIISELYSMLLLLLLLLLLFYS